MANRLDDLDRFVKLMKRKIIHCSDKNKEDTDLDFEIAKNHLISEICELFNLIGVEKYLVKDTLKNKEIEQDELVDVANMCWICNYLVVK